ncbi:MAG TPA: hypothetical protein VM509_00135 [Planctomycetota bacterium]|nr:hypothetical protein [Planctomycetota bacterium]
MKLTLIPFLPLILLACSKDAPVSKPAAGKTESSAQTSAPAVPASGESAQKPALSAAAPPTAAPSTAPPSLSTDQPTKSAATGNPGTATTQTTPPVTQTTLPTTQTKLPGTTETTLVPGTATKPLTATSTSPQLETVQTPIPGANPGAAPGQGPATTPPPAAPPAKTQPAAVQMPTTPPTPCPVVLAPQSKVDQLALSGKNLGGPIKVYDQTIDENAIRRFLCYGVGGKHIDMMKFDIICRGEIAKRKAAGVDVSQLTVSDAEVEKSLANTRKDFLVKYPSLDFPTEVARAYLHLDVYVSELKPSLLFTKVFFPEDPRNWPGVTTEAIIMASNGRGFIDDSIENYDQRKQLMVAQGLDEVPPDDPILTDSLRQWLLEALNQFSVIETDQAKLPADTLMIVDGEPIKVDDVWKVFAPHITWEHVSEARRFLAQMAVVEHDLRARGALLTQEEFEKSFAPKGNFREALSAYEMVGIVLQGFPSMQACMRYEHLQRSYRNVIKDDIATDAPMMPYLQRANMIAGAAKIDAEVILCSAFDFPQFRWKVDGWKTAEAKAKELQQKLANGADWGDTLELYSEFWDPPMPEVGQKPQFGFAFKGRFGQQTRNQLAGDLLETDYTTFLTGKSLADEIFFDQKGGTISEPQRGPRGYYITRINSRSPASAGLNLAAPANRDFLVNYVCMARFGAYARQALTDALAKGDVKGF